MSSVWIKQTLTILGFLVCTASPIRVSAQTENNPESFAPKVFPEVFESTWESLESTNNHPEWFQDAKLGIYFHWGPYCVPAFQSEWYPRFMHLENPPRWGAGIKEHHQETYGDPSEFGYHDFFPKFTCEKFDPDEWAELFSVAGAKFAGPVAQHHDGFSMWASDVNPNSVIRKGPKRDILGELFESLRAKDLKTIATFHHSFTGQRQRDGEPEGRSLSYYPYKPEYFTSSDDPELRKLYGNLTDDEFNDYWLQLVQEVVGKYSPDIIWFDSWLDVIPDNYVRRMASYHYNAGASRGQEVVLACKQDDMPDSTRVLDIEQGGMKGLPDRVWMTDVTLSFKSWSYIEGQTYKPLPLLVRNMIDVWSKRGVVLLNISPRADGVIVQEQRDRLIGLGGWLETYGEAVYGTRPHVMFGYGEAKIKDGSHGGQAATIKYSASDIRFTRSKDGKTVFVFLLGQPAAGSQIQIQHLNEGGESGFGIKNVSFLGIDEVCDWKFANGTLTMPAPKPSPLNEIATVLRVDLVK
ncbi:MAG: alpha-L-fucosidase [Planctomycetota bacterium]